MDHHGNDKELFLHTEQQEREIHHALFKLNSQQEKESSYGFAVNYAMFPVRMKDVGSGNRIVLSTQLLQ
jgi:hypothetical protein